MQTVILCGGMGTRLREETEFRPKPMVEIGGRPILWHIMKYYAHFGFKEFILALGYRGDVIRDYFINYKLRRHDFTIELETGRIDIHRRSDGEDWRVTLVETGDAAMTGARLKRIEPFLRGDRFFLTYGDGLSTIPIDRLLAFHRSHGGIGTVSGVLAPSRFGELAVEGRRVVRFSEKPRIPSRYVCGGFYVFERRFLREVSADDSCILERDPLERMAASRELFVYLHDGFWHSMDTYRDYLFLNEMWQRHERPWALWEGEEDG